MHIAIMIGLTSLFGIFAIYCLISGVIFSIENFDDEEYFLAIIQLILLLGVGTSVFIALIAWIWS